MDLGIFSLSLTVKDIAASKAFYENLGFEPLEGAGSVADKWLILIKEEVKIGLFQDMFPQNILTFNPPDARSLHQRVKDFGAEVAYANGMDKAEGPCSFSVLDPDGNPILFDQF